MYYTFTFSARVWILLDASFSSMTKQQNREKRKETAPKNRVKEKDKEQNTQRYAHFITRVLTNESDTDSFCIRTIKSSSLFQFEVKQVEER